mmetsp:Transcript_48444/g.130523  ORF Transcript_48444/g.130523 Transcript_48444/m.130523 type:complete len:504 (-) Transcript_48444:122-1633(-)
MPCQSHVATLFTLFLDVQAMQLGSDGSAGRDAGTMLRAMGAELSAMEAVAAAMDRSVEASAWPAGWDRAMAADSHRSNGGLEWLQGFSTEGDAECSVQDQCIVGSGSGTCKVMVDPSMAVPLGSTDSGYDCDFGINNTMYRRAARYAAPASDITVVGHSQWAHWNLCWAAASLGSRSTGEEQALLGRRASEEPGVESYCYYVNGICFLWATPCSGGCSQLNALSSYSAFCPTLRYATSEEWSAALPSLNANRNAFYSKCAASRIDPRWNHCDSSNTFVRIEDNSYNELVLVCDVSAAPSPTPSPLGATPVPTPEAHPMTAVAAAAASGSAAAVGDPHLQNIHGERFDLMKPGKHVLLHVPRKQSLERVFLRVDAEVRRLGGQCADMYFQGLNITGQWVEAKGTSGLRFQAQDAQHGKPKWYKFGTVQVKVAHGRTQNGDKYLNFYVKHLGHSGIAVGGLLGEDDHTEAAMPSKACSHHLSLLQLPSQSFHTASSFSVAEASLA